MPRLPNKPSDLIRVALEDLRKTERSSLYEVNMSYWHTPRDDETCLVCLAGSVMAMTLGDDPRKETWPDAISRKNEEVITKRSAHTYRRMEALDNLRCGHVGTAVEELGKNYWRIWWTDKNEVHRKAIQKLRGTWVQYADDPGMFKRKLGQVARILEKMGL